MNDPHGEPALTFEWTYSASPSVAVINALAEVSHEEPLQMNPLYSVVDPDALDALFPQNRSPNEPSDGRVEFEYGGYRVIMKAHGRGYIYSRKVNEGASSDVIAAQDD